jgi:subtilisin family serine protease
LSISLLPELWVGKVTPEITARDALDTWISLEPAREALEKGRGAGIKVAILDSGVESDHPALGGMQLADDIAISSDDLQLKVQPGGGRDLFGHGTAIAGIIHQIAPEAQIGSFRVLGEQLRARTAVICEGVRQAMDRGYHILNCSFGCGREDLVLAYKNWIDEAYIRGRHIVASCNNFDFMKREWPGHFPTVITVNFLNGSSDERLHYRAGTLVEFAASGQDVEVAWSGGGKKKVTGSSFAAPRAAGLLCRLLSRMPSLSPLQAKALLCQLAADK